MINIEIINGGIPEDSKYYCVLKLLNNAIAEHVIRIASEIKEQENNKNTAKSATLKDDDAEDRTMAIAIQAISEFFKANDIRMIPEDLSFDGLSGDFVLQLDGAVLTLLELKNQQE